jgi:hypothetical protein
VGSVAVDDLHKISRLRLYKSTVVEIMRLTIKEIERVFLQ